jgi:hypothetical protein
VRFSLDLVGSFNSIYICIFITSHNFIEVWIHTHSTGVPWIIELWNNSDCKLQCMQDNLLNLNLRVCLFFSESRIIGYISESLELKRKTIIVYQVPVEYVEL